jgi:hypothetical protein
MWIGLIAVAFGITTFVAPPTAHSATIDSPGSPGVTFDSWSAGQSNLTVTWTAVAGADGYEVAQAPGDTAPSSPGSATVVTGGASDSAPITAGYSGSDVSVSVFAYTGAPGNVTALSAPASVTFAIPGAPTLNSSAVSGTRGVVKLVWSAPSFAGDQLVLREGTGSSSGPTSGTAVPISDGDTSVEVSGLPDGNPGGGVYFTMYELGASGSDDWAYSSNLAFAAPTPEGAMVAPDITDDATQMHVSWGSPGCDTIPGQECNHAVLVENPGSQVAGDPTDGKVETDHFGIPGGTGFNVTDVVPGHTYTFTVFNVAVRDTTLVWSASRSETAVDRAQPDVFMTSIPANAAAEGSPVTLYASLGTTIGTTPTGSVTFQTARHVLCANVALTSRTARCETTATQIGAGFPTPPAQAVTIDAHYSGDGTDYPSDANIEFAIEKARPVMQLKTKGQRTRRVTIKAVVGGAAGRAAGHITMASGRHVICRAKPLVSGVVACKATTRKLGAGRHKVKVHYSGSSLYLARTARTTIKLAK